MAFTALFPPLLLLTTAITSSAVYLGLQEGQVCHIDSRDRSWLCEKPKLCPQLGDLRKSDHHICGFHGREPIVCCPPAPRGGQGKPKPIKETAPNPVRPETNSKRPVWSHKPTVLPKDELPLENIKVRPSVTSCRQYNKCNPPKKPGTFEIAVVGGVNSKSKAHPHMALIGFGPKNNKRWVCGGSLISEKFVISAAHCSPGSFDGPAKWVRLGELDISTEEDDADPQDFQIIRRFDHPLYKSPRVYNDISLYELDKAVTITEWVKPICLHTDNQVGASHGTVTGWGRIDFVGPTSDALQEVSIPIVSNEECLRQYPPSSSPLVPSGVNTTIMVCAGEKDGGKDACIGDSGGPLVVRDPGCRFDVLAGIISFGKQCALPEQAGIYTRVAHYVDWIESVVWKV